LKSGFRPREYKKKELVGLGKRREKTKGGEKDRGKRKKEIMDRKLHKAGGVQSGLVPMTVRQERQWGKGDNTRGRGEATGGNGCEMEMAAYGYVGHLKKRKPKKGGSRTSKSLIQTSVLRRLSPKGGEQDWGGKRGRWCIFFLIEAELRTRGWCLLK